VLVTLSVLILNVFDSDFQLSKIQMRVAFAGLTAAKSMIATHWKPSHDLSVRTWTLSFLDVLYMEISTARINGASEKTLDTWVNIANSLENML